MRMGATLMDMRPLMDLSSSRPGSLMEEFKENMVILT